MNIKNYYTESIPFDGCLEPALYTSTFCCVHSPDTILLLPISGLSGFQEIPVVVGDQGVSLKPYVSKLIADCIAASIRVPVEAIRDLENFYDYLSDPSNQARIDRDTARDSYFAPTPGKFCRVTADNVIEISAGQFPHRIQPEALTGQPSDLGVLLEELRHKIWFTDEVKLELCDLVASLGVRELVGKIEE